MSETYQEVGAKNQGVMPAKRSLCNRVQALLSGWSERQRALSAEETLDTHVGNIALVGDFGYVIEDEKRTAIAKRVVKTLRENGVIEEDSPVDVRTMVPDIARGEHDRSLDVAALSLAHVLDDTSQANQYLHYDPITVSVDGHKDIRTNIKSSINSAAPDCEGEAFGEKLVIVANPFLLAQAFPNLTYATMNNGGVAKLERNNQFVQVWPVAPLISE
jgi:hypothetical protein